MMGTSHAQRLRLQLMAAAFLERLGERIRERREALNLSRPDVVSQMSGRVNENQLYRWEKGLHQPNPDTLEELARILECDVADLMAPEPDKTSTPDPFEVQDPTTAALARIEQSLNDLVERLVAAGLLAAVEKDTATAPPPTPAKRPKRAA
jgi:transcriptional regulator with XRE-family HTH domain